MGRSIVLWLCVGTVVGHQQHVHEAVPLADRLADPSLRDQVDRPVPAHLHHAQDAGPIDDKYGKLDKIDAEQQYGENSLHHKFTQDLHQDSYPRHQEYNNRHPAYPEYEFEEDITVDDPAHPDFPEDKKYFPTSSPSINQNFQGPYFPNLYSLYPQNLYSAYPGAQYLQNHFQNLKLRQTLEHLLAEPAEQLELPSKSRFTGYTPEEIIRFRDEYRALRVRYPDQPLITLEDHLKVEEDLATALTLDNMHPMGDEHAEHRRGGRVLGLGLGGLVGLGMTAGNNLGLGMGGLNGLFNSMGFGNNFGWGAGGVFNPVGSLVSGNQFSVGYDNTDVRGVGSAAGDAVGLNKSKRKQFAGIEPCSNGNGVCEKSSSCLADGGVIKGKCDADACEDCGSCCQYVYEDCMYTSNKTISFFQSPNFPDTRREAYTCSLSFEVRHDVDQVLIEFIIFELPISRKGCTEEDYLEIISPQKAHGVFGEGNSRLCGHNTGQHVYLDVNPGDLLILKVTTSGVQSVPLAVEGAFGDEYEYHGNYAYRFKIKVTQIFKAGGYIDSKRSDVGKLVFKQPTPGLGSVIINKYGEIPNYYTRLRGDAGCIQYYFENRGQIESFNYDGKSRFPNNLDYSICIRTPKDACGLKIKALTFDLPTNVPWCMNGTNQVYWVDSGAEMEPTREWYPCCTSGYSDERVSKYIGIDGTSDGKTYAKKFIYDQYRYFFCGQSLGRTNFVESGRKGPLRIQVHSDDKLCPHYKGKGVGFRLKYDIETGTC